MHFLLAKGYKQDIATRHVVDYDQIQLDPDCESALMTHFNNNNNNNNVHNFVMRSATP